MINRYIHFLLAIISLVFITCSKSGSDNPDENMTGDPGSVTTTINGKEWRSRFHSAVYYTKWNQVVINASDNKSYIFYSGINLNLANPLGHYLLESNGSNMSKVEDGSDNYIPRYTDGNIPDAGGYFDITRFDTTQKLLSGQTSFVAYTADRSGRLTFTGDIVDIPLKLDTQSYNGNFGKCTVAGVTTTSRYSKDVIARIECSVTVPVLTIRLYSISGSSLLLFDIPLNKTIGNYPIFPDGVCNIDNVTAKYSYPSSTDFNAVSGNFNILSIDAATKTLTGKFNLTVNHPGFNETIQITNGDLSVKWQ